MPISLGLQGGVEGKRPLEGGSGEPNGQPCLLGTPLPFMDSASFIPQSDSHRAVFVQVKLFTVQVIVWSHPSNPDAGRVLASEDANGIVALLCRDDRVG